MFEMSVSTYMAVCCHKPEGYSLNTMNVRFFLQVNRVLVQF